MDWPVTVRCQGRLCQSLMLHRGDRRLGWPLAAPSRGRLRQSFAVQGVRGLGQSMSVRRGGRLGHTVTLNDGSTGRIIIEDNILLVGEA